MRSYISEGSRRQIFCQLTHIHLCHAGCRARNVRNIFLCAPSTTSLLVTIIGASIYHNYIFSCFFVFFVFTSSCFLLLRQSVVNGAREMYWK